MSAEVTIALGVAGRVLANIACANNPRLGAAFVGVSNGLLVHRAWIAHTLFEPLTLLILAAGLVFDHKMYGGFEEAVTAVLAFGLGVVLADFGPDLWYELVGEQFTKDMSRELDALGLFSFIGDDSSSDVDDRSDAGSVVSRATASSRRTSRSGRTGTSVTVRPTRSTRPRPTPRPASTITRLSRVTFDETSITPSQSSDVDVEEDFETSAGTSTQLGLTNGDALSGSGADDLYMEPSTTSGSSNTRFQTVQHRPSILRRLHIPGQETTLPSTLSQSSSSRTRLTSDGSTTPRATTRPTDFTPITPSSAFEPAPPLFPEPDLSSSSGYQEYSPRIIPPSEPTPDLSSSIALPEPVYLPEPAHTTPSEEEDHGPSRLSRMMNVPIVPHTPEEQVYLEHEHAEASPESARLWAPPDARSASRRSGSRSRSRSRSPAGPRPQPPSHHESPPASIPPVADAPGSQSFISETYDDSTVDVRELDRDSAISRIEEAWKHVEKKHHRRLNILVRHDDDDGQQSRNNSTFHLMEDLENLRFNFKIRPGIIIITSRSRAG